MIKMTTNDAEMLKAMCAPLSKYMRENQELSPAEALYCFYSEKCELSDAEIAKEFGRAFNTVRNARANASKKRKQKFII